MISDFHHLKQASKPDVESLVPIVLDVKYSTTCDALKQQFLLSRS